MPTRMTTQTARPIPRSIAGVLGELELLSPQTVTRDLISRILANDPDGRGRPTDPVIDTLRRCGWLLPLHTRGVWEFAPAARSGAFTSGDPFLELRAHLERHPHTVAAVAMESAAFVHALAEHPPARDVLAVSPGTPREGAMSCYRLVPLNLGPTSMTDVDDTPIHTIEALLVSMAIRPSGFRDWPNVTTWLNEAGTRVLRQTVDEPRGSEANFSGASRELSLANDPPSELRQGCQGLAGCLALIRGFPTASWARFAYLLRRAGYEDAAAEVLEQVPTVLSGPVYLGPRTPNAHYDPVTHVMDSLLGTR